MKFKYLDNVRVLSGFYAGFEGFTVGISKNDREIYLVELTGGGRSIEEFQENLEKVQDNEF